MRCLEIKREMHSDDIALVTELLDLAARIDGRRPLSDHLYLDLVGGGQEGFVGVVARDPGHRHPVGYAQVSNGNDSVAVELVIHPDHRSDQDTIGPELMDAALDVVRSEGGAEVNWWVYEPTPAHRSLAAHAGMEQGRTLYQMRRRLPAERHASISTRAFVPGVDDEAWLAVNNRAFADHSEQGGWTIDTLLQRQAEEWFDSEGFRLHERDGRLAGFCWTKVHHPAPATRPDGQEHDQSNEGDDIDTGLGEIYVIAVDPDFHGLGLGSEMTLAGLDHLTDAGIGTALLYVDADNEGAVAMYEKLGFSVHSTTAAFSAHVHSGPDAVADHLDNR